MGESFTEVKTDEFYGLKNYLRAFSDRLAMVHRGRIIAGGTPDELRAMTDQRVLDFIRGSAPPNEDVATLLGE